MGTIGASRWRTGGGAFYGTGAYDPASNLTYWGSGNPVPAYDNTTRPGDNRFTSSAIAFDGSNGKITWWHQYTPNDNRDYDETGAHILIDAKINGEDRRIPACGAIRNCATSPTRRCCGCLGCSRRVAVTAEARSAGALGADGRSRHALDRGE